MLERDKISLMTKIAMYESTQEKQDFRITSYFKKDYVSLQTLISCLWVTLGYFVVLGVVTLTYMDDLLNELTVNRVIQLISYAVAAYLVVIVLYVIACSILYGGKHKRAKKRIKNYYKDMSKLERMLSKENKNV